MIDKAEIAKNKKLVHRYPFLAPKEYDWDYYEETGNDRLIIPDTYDYTWTWLDGMPNGWREAFGADLCKELWDELVKHDYLDGYVIYDVKEKYGMLRIYDGGVPIGAESIWDVIEKYSKLSEVTCCNCGKPATKITKGYILPFCDDCISPKAAYVEIGDKIDDD